MLRHRETFCNHTFLTSTALFYLYLLITRILKLASNCRWKGFDGVCKCPSICALFCASIISYRYSCSSFEQVWPFTMQRKVGNLRHDTADKFTKIINPLSANLTKWSNTLKQFVGKLPTNCLNVFDHFVKLKFCFSMECFAGHFFVIWEKESCQGMLKGVPLGIPLRFQEYQVIFLKSRSFMGSLRLMSFGNSCGNSYIHFLVMINLVPFHLWWKEVFSFLKKSTNILSKTMI